MRVLNNGNLECTGHAYILKILMTAKKCSKKLLELFPLDQQPHPFDERTLILISLFL